LGTRNPAKDVLHYRGELPPTHDKYHIMIKGNLFILFERNQAAILPGHDKVIRDKAVDFLVKAVRALGPDNYNLSVLGMASATASATTTATWRDSAIITPPCARSGTSRNFRRPTSVTQVLWDDLSRARGCLHSAPQAEPTPTAAAEQHITRPG